MIRVLAVGKLKDRRLAELIADYARRIRPLAPFELVEVRDGPPERVRRDLLKHLQSIVNNLVSGLILLFERPVRVGDFIEVGGKWAEIRKIGLRATNVQTFDQADVIIPNADLVSTQVINWTLSNRRVRLIIPVGVAYGSDISLVMETLIACTRENSKIAEAPPPQVLFLKFGESALEFELRVWVLDADNRLVVSSELHQEIDRRFREAKIEIAFPQQDLHLRSVDESIVLKSTKTTS